MVPDDFSKIAASSLNSSMSPSSSSSTYSASWTWIQDKQFETALAIVPEGAPDRWEQIARQVPGKTAEEVEKHYEILVQDVMAIESGSVDLPVYTEDESVDRDFEASSELSSQSQINFGSKPSKCSETERKRGTPWTEEEHRLFLMGLQKYGKGDWRSISRNAVVSRTPTQVASHAQKYFNRLNSDKKEKKRSSIHDIVLNQNERVIPPSSDVTLHQPIDPLSSQLVPFPPDNQTMIPPNNQGMIPPNNQPLLAMNPPLGSQMQFPNQGGSLGYQNFGYRM